MTGTTPDQRTFADEIEYSSDEENVYAEAEVIPPSDRPLQEAAIWEEVGDDVTDSDISEEPHVLAKGFGEVEPSCLEALADIITVLESCASRAVDIMERLDKCEGALDRLICKVSELAKVSSSGKSDSGKAGPLEPVKKATVKKKRRVGQPGRPVKEPPKTAIPKRKRKTKSSAKKVIRRTTKTVKKKAKNK